MQSHPYARVCVHLNAENNFIAPRASEEDSESKIDMQKSNLRDRETSYITTYVMGGWNVIIIILQRTRCGGSYFLFFFSFMTEILNKSSRRFSIAVQSVHMAPFVEPPLSPPLRRSPQSALAQKLQECSSIE